MIDSLLKLFSVLFAPFVKGFEARRAETMHLVEADIQLLKQLWPYLLSWNVESFVSSYSQGRITDNLLDNFTDYLERRRHPEFQLYDKKLEHILSEFDNALNVAIDKGSNTFFPAPESSGVYLHEYRDVKPGSADYYALIAKLKVFEETELANVRKTYEQLVKYLKQKHIYHRLLSADTQ